MLAYQVCFRRQLQNVIKAFNYFLTLATKDSDVEERFSHAKENCDGPNGCCRIDQGDCDSHADCCNGLRCRDNNMFDFDHCHAGKDET